VTELPESLTVDGYLIIIDTGIVLDAEQTNSVKENIGSEGIFSKNNLKVAIEIDLIDSKDYLDVNRDYSDTIFERIFGDDNSEWYDYQSITTEYEINNILQYDIDDENENKIKELVQTYIENNDMSEETEDMDLAEKIVYLDLDEIKTALSSAYTDSINNAHQKWMIENVVDAYKEYGSVDVLQWDEIRLTVDLSDHILSMDKEYFDNNLNGCSTNLECWFNEMKGSEIDKPMFFPHPQHDSLPDDEDFNQRLFDRLLEIEY
jgi:hypothetical protein